MPDVVPAEARCWTIIAQDPAVKLRGKIVRAKVDVPVERLLPGPRGHRVHVVDYDTSARAQYRLGRVEPEHDPFADASDAQLLRDPAFHRRNVYAVVMRTLALFERALGRRVDWGSSGHQIYVVPHAFCDANAFYSRADHALLFGYFPGRAKGRAAASTVFTCLSHDIVVHETAHALLDGLRERFMDPSGPDQAAFHEGFADIVALLSVLSQPQVVGKVLDITARQVKLRGARRGGQVLLPANRLTYAALADTGLFGLADEMGQELVALRGDALRRSVKLKRDKRLRDGGAHSEFSEPHRRGEILVAAVMQTFLEAWCARIRTLGAAAEGWVNRDRVVEDGAGLADALLTMAIRALDYCPPVDVEFEDYLSAMLTADRELRRDDASQDLRVRLRATFADFGIQPAANPKGSGCWNGPQHPEQLVYHRTHFESMQRDPQELFRFVWQNMAKLTLDDSAYTQVLSVRPCFRVAPDGFVLRETVAEVHQTIELDAKELPRGVQRPQGMPDDQRVILFGGSTLVFDEYGRLKYEIHKSIGATQRQSSRLEHLWRQASSDHPTDKAIGIGNDNQRLHRLHRQRATLWTGPRRKEDVL